MHTHIHIQTPHTCIHTCTLATYTHAHTHTHTHTHTLTHNYMQDGTNMIIECCLSNALIQNRVLQYRCTYPKTHVYKTTNSYAEAIYRYQCSAHQATFSHHLTTQMNDSNTRLCLREVVDTLFCSCRSLRRIPPSSPKQ